MYDKAVYTHIGKKDLVSCRREQSAARRKSVRVSVYRLRKRVL